MAEHEQYFEYLKRRSKKALIYRNFYLYPRLCTYLKGLCLDVGCGLGDMLRYRKNTIGADVNPYLVEYCKQMGLDARLIEDGRIPFKDESFQSAILDNVLEHLASPFDVLSEIYRVLEMGGRFIVGVPGEKGYRQDSDHKIFYDENKLIDTLRLTHFERHTILHMPIQSNWLNENLSPYCLYGVFFKR